MEKVQVVRQIDTKIKLIYQKMKAKMLMDARDFCIARFTELGSDFATMLNISVKSAEVPEIKGNVRADQHVLIYYLILVWWNVFEKSK